MAVDTPASIAVLGAGPIGLEAALYARCLGYDVDVYERGTVGENLRRFAHVRLFSPFRMNASSLGLAALEAQDPHWAPPDADALLTAGELVESYLLPLSRSDLLVDSIREQVRVLAVGRDGSLKGELVGDASRGERPFRILLENADGQQQLAEADVVLDASGTFGNPNSLGRGGIPALGESAATGRIEHGLPDLSGEDRSRYANRRLLVLGAGYSAATNIIALAQLAEEEHETHITWITRRVTNDIEGPIPLIANDRLPERDRIARTANDIVRGERDCLTHWPGTTIDRIESQGDGWVVHTVGRHAGTIEVDRILANVGFRPDSSIYSELQIHECYASSGPMKLAATLGSSPDCLDQIGGGPQSLLNPEPNFYILGAKSYGRNSKFLIKIGLEQIRDVFKLIGGREGLDLYSTVQPSKLALQGR